MDQAATSRYGDSTRAIHAGTGVSTADAFCEPIAMTSGYAFDSARDAWERFTGASPGNVYSRFTNPTVSAMEQRVASLEEATDGVAFSSGMGAITALCMALCSPSNNIVCSRDMFGTTLNVFKTYMRRFGVYARFVPVDDPHAWTANIDERTAFVLLETPSNPMMRVADLQHITQLAHARGAKVIVDNTMLTPVLQKPLRFGADAVVHSAGKYMDGQGRSVAGVVTCGKELGNELRGVLRTLGICLSPMNAWLIFKGLETLELRVDRAAESAHRLATWLAGNRHVERVHYTGLSSHRQHALAMRQQAGHGGVLSFELAGGRDRAWRFIDQLKLVARCTNIGDSRSMVTHPASTTHCRMTPQELQAAGIEEGLVRLSVGLENVPDLIADIDQALERSVTSLPKMPWFERIYAD